MDNQSTDLASYGTRLYAYLIDQSVIQLVALGLSYPILAPKLQQAGQDIVALAALLQESTILFVWVQVAVAVLYGALFEGGKSGATWGKWYCHIRVANGMDQPIGYLMASLRNIGLNLAFVAMVYNIAFGLVLLLPYLTPLIWVDRQTVYDKMLGVFVIKTPAPSVQQPQ